jgi:hypothetical protein
MSPAFHLSPHEEQKAGGVQNPLGETNAFSLLRIRSCDEDHRHHLAVPQALQLPFHTVHMVWGEVYILLLHLHRGYC